MDKIIIVMLSAFLIPSIPTKIEYINPEPIQTAYDIELDQWLEKLAHCESRNNPQAMNHYDGGSRSVGYLQFKDDTFKRYNDKFGFNYTAEDIYNKDAQLKVAKEIIKQDYRWQNWTNCVTKHGVGKPPIKPTSELTQIS